MTRDPPVKNRNAPGGQPGDVSKREALDPRGKQRG
jgi:hypothetical protein